MPMIMKKTTHMMVTMARNEQDAHMFDTEDQELKEKATKEKEFGTVSG